MRVFCTNCGSQADFDPAQFRCECGGAWETVERADFDPALIDREDRSLWRYRQLLGLDFEQPAVRLGEGWTPLVALPFRGREVLCKLEYFGPTASFKDRGSAVMINTLIYQGVTHIAEDSSGNAGASIAAYAARAGIRAEIYVPAHASPAKQAQIAIYGAEVRPIDGPRVNAKLAALAARERGVTIAAHAYHPAFLLGQQTVGWELWEQTPRLPDWYIVPVGQGLHLLGAWLAFRRLRAAGLIERLPRLVAVQAARLAPVVRAWEAGLDAVPAVELPPIPSLAEGLAIAEPVRGRRILQALRESGGLALAVEEEAITAAQHDLARCGLFVEPTCATAAAALDAIYAQAAPDEVIAVGLTGSGLKGVPQT
ncbi:MAG: threonine synthase [Anaerolineae bacterium]